jgi:hypothetical protein
VDRVAVAKDFAAELREAMLTDSPPRNANREGFLESDRIRTLELPQDRRLLPLAKSIELAMTDGTTAAVRLACVEFLTSASEFYNVHLCGTRVLGDAADGYPGLPGWGAKSSAAVLAKFLHIESIPTDCREWRVKAANASALAGTLCRERERAMLFRTLATLRTDIALFDDVDQLRWNGPTPAFDSLAARLDAASTEKRQPATRQSPSKSSLRSAARR